MKNGLVVKNLTVSYDHFSALWDINFEISCGQIVGIIGPNGAGKSTLIKALIGLIKPISGGAEFCGMDLKKNRKRVAYVPQKKGIDWQFPITVFDVVLMGCYGRLKGLKWYRRSDRDRALQLLTLMQMKHLHKRQISALSVGQQQRLFIARALMQDADLLLLDEPFAGVDKTTETLIMQVLTELKAQGKTILIVHHDLNTVEAYFDALIILKTSLIACGKTEAVFHLKHLNRAYGAKGVIFDEAIRLSLSRFSGLR